MIMGLHAMRTGRCASELAAKRTLMGLRSKKQKMPGRLDPADASLLLKYSLTLYWLVLTVTFRMFV